MEVVELKKNIELAFLTLGEKLYKIRDEELYLSNWESFVDYLDEVKISPSVASRLITVYEKMVLEYELSTDLIANAGGWSNAYEILQISSGKTDAKKWLKESENRLPKDTKIALREARTGIKQDECKHEDFYTIDICRKCGAKIRTYEEEND